ncbi:nuclear transcription factor Y subunit B-6-like [Diospyros lotus]|uniref:nuclear transcription factor Y subunit B-6-like n=1 Tax=Diospyros lotus TaxID=55363 RepID=UPI00225C1A03|nr:nuclear transcription factor Y subunit B-6-like [Diospyros lotus]
MGALIPVQALVIFSKILVFYYSSDVYLYKLILVIPSNLIEEPTKKKVHQVLPALDNDRHFPVSKVIKIMPRALPPKTHITKEAIQVMQHYTTNCIHLVTANTNIGCKQDNRKKVFAKDVISTIGRIGLEGYVEPLTLYLNEYRGMKQNCGVVLAKGSRKKRHAMDVNDSLENDDTRDNNANPSKDDDAEPSSLHQPWLK